MEKDGPSPVEKRAALEEVLRSTTFLRADQLRKFLRYICQMEIDGRGSELREFLIGVEAFGRAPDYSTAEDSAVRRRAVDLREKLRQVYSSELTAAALRIELPKGTYVPRFVQAERADNELGLAPAPVNRTPALEPTASPERHLPVSWIAASSFALGAILTALAFLFLPHLILLLSRISPPPAEPGVTFEAEARGNIFAGFATPDLLCEMCSGGARVRRIGDGPRHYLVITGVTVEKDGNYAMAVHYVLKGSRSFFVSVNDGSEIQVPLNGDSWVKPAKAVITVPLHAGHNSIKFYNDTAFAPDLDRIVIR